MKKLLLITTALLMLSACSKDNNTLENTSWMWFLSNTTTSIETGEVYDIQTFSFKIDLETSTHGHAYANTYTKIHLTEDTIGTSSYYGMFDVSYTYDSEKKEGNITFTKENSENSYLWANQTTSSFYYDGDNKIIIDTTPYSVFNPMILNKE
ncbi:MAG: membrane lipoprotein lipid attachment site-containing protein [Bacteroidales bacterium]|nr:membrane lipoprotein lipid attachment site-containing protein [Bacteroidales bacterium]